MKSVHSLTQSVCNYLYCSMNKICWSQILKIDNMKRIWNKLNILYKITDVFLIIDLHHQLATVKFNPWNSNAYTERIKRIANEIKKLDENSQDFINTLQIVKRILLNQIQLLSQIRSLLLTEFIIEKMTSLIHAQQIVNLNSQDSRSSAGLTVAGRKCKTNKQLQKLKNNENWCSNCEKIDHLESSCWFKYLEKAPAWWNSQPNANIQWQTRMTAQLPDHSVQQLQITNQLYTETSQQSQQECVYLMNVNTVYRAQSDINNSENFKTYQAHITDRIAKQEHLVIIRDWILDSEASHHFCVNISQFIDSSLIYIKEDIKIINDDNVKSENKNKIRLVMNKSAKFSSILIINAIYASALKVNLLSSNVLDLDHDLHVNLDVSLKSSQILKEETVIENLICYNNLYLMNLINTNTITLLLWAIAASKKSIFLWYWRLVYLKLNSVKKLQNLMIDIEFDKTVERHKNLIEKSKNQVQRKFKICKICVRNKQRKRLLNTRKKNLYWHSIKFFDLIHSDICEMSENYDEFQYFIIFINDYTYTIFVKCLQIKNEAFQTFKNFYAFIQT